MILCAMLLTASSAHAERANSIYLEAFGKGGLWGLGYDHRLDQRYSLGVVGSAENLSGQKYVSMSPYVGIAIARHGRSSWFADFGAQAVYAWAASPVPEWEGDSSAGIGGTLSTGYEFRGQLMFRIYAHGVIGKGGAVPWAGTGLGWAF